ncbi:MULTISPECIES: neuraminidase-like domain-containing protein [unclassified Pseudomonas]|uniref:Tc toxin subunit A-related protein n=1 Tax=unclassified Pseudomonas TaxID=196821 RepID=UPI000D3C1EB7|nr:MULTISPECIES: neuraminidase-like domain-containing protein [unclassified Pseudomonas]RAU45800.1 hypothetical protein DBP26_012535 [Pseudomonas sp. RIT 409]RAU56101.1 hypothetical protein DBY65_002960 [Pseudomonas sp. RIT 412]
MDYDAQMDQALRDALVAYYLGQLIPAPESSAPDNIITPDDLYEYLLIDNQVSADVDTSRVAQGIASLQQHIHAIYGGMEPGFAQIPDTAAHRKQVNEWHETMSQYSVWAGYQALVDYPENYLDPSLRQGKTEAFQALESELSQSRLTADSVQNAVSNYLARFEEVSNLQTVCCYIDGVDFRQADYYFVGRSATDTSRYYWRKVAIDLDDSSTRVPPSAWSEWKPIDIQLAGHVTHVRAAVVDGRLHLVWLEQVRQALDAADTPVSGSFLYRLNASYLQNTGRWSDALILHECLMPSFEDLDRLDYVLIAALDDRVTGQPCLAVGFIQSKLFTPGTYAFLHVRDKHWQPVNLSTASRTSMFAALVKQLGDGGAAAAQHVMVGAEGTTEQNAKVWILDSVVWDEVGDNHEGALSRYLEVETPITSIEGACTINAVGVCNTPWYQTGNEGIPFRGNFGLWKGQPRSPYSLTLNGAARTPVMPIGWSADAGNPNAYTLRFGMHDTTNGLGYRSFTVTRKERSKAPITRVTDEGGNFLDLEGLALPNLRFIRLNSTFAGELVRKAERSLDGVLGWETQHTLEPPTPNAEGETKDEPWVPVDFNGANGLYFWELFFHLPHLVAWRLHHSFEYAGAERWLNYLFNPQVRVAPLYPPPDQVDWMPYWTSRPLGFADDPMQDIAAPRDPNAIAYGAPSHYRKAIFTLYLDNLIAWGDSRYRQVTRDALNEAKLLYVRAISLLGPLSKGRSISQWAPMSLQDAARHETETFDAFEATRSTGLLQGIPRRVSQAPWVRLVDAPWFRLPVNTRLLDLWDTLDARLYNLRNNLTLDGQPLSLALYEMPANPLDLLRAQLAGGGASLRRLGAQAIIPPYRFSAMLPRTRQAVDTLTRFGEQVLRSMASADRAEQDALQQGHWLELAGFAAQLAGLAVEQAERSLEVLTARQDQLQLQIGTYDNWIARDVSVAERDAEAKLEQASAMRISAAGMRAGGHGMGTAPNTITFLPGLVPIPVPGGWNWGGPSWAAASAAEATGMYLSDSADSRLRADAYNRRRDEWTFLKEQAQQQLEPLARQMEQAQVSTVAAKAARDRSLKACEQAQALYALIRNRATNGALHLWMQGQMSTLYFQAYDAVLSMCLATEACWQYEMGDYQTAFIPTSAWVDNRRGLTAGESLSLGLLQMESAFVARHERRLELVKTVSLRTLLKDHPARGTETGWPAVLAELRKNGAIEFQLKPSLFDLDHPGHYLRQLVTVSVSLPGSLGPYENARVTLDQLTNSCLLKPDLGGSKYQYKQVDELPGEDEGSDPRFVVANKRVNQRVAISADRQDPGVIGASPTDERYLPFEGTGAISSWLMTFPRHAQPHQQSLIDGLQDVILHLRYRALDGGPVFAAQVKDLIPVQRRTPQSLTQQGQPLPAV